MHTMKTTLKSALAAISVAVLVTFAFSGCKSRQGDSTGGSHNMGDNRKYSPMPNEDMPGRN